MPNYFSGANCFVKVGSQPILEVAGVSYQEIDSQTPIYGYSSRYFDAVAPGQKLIKGNLVINFTRPDYLAYAIAKGKDVAKSAFAEATEIVNNPVDNERKKQKAKYEAAAKKAFKNRFPDQEFMELDVDKRDTLIFEQALKNLENLPYDKSASEILNMANSLGSDSYEDAGRDDVMTALFSPTKDVTAQVAINIDIVIGNKHVIRLLDCYITSRGSVIQIDESTLVEEYSFFARNLKTVTVR